jgi:hypothetical protein
MTIIRVLVVELICQAVMGRILLLECLSVRSTGAHVATSYHARHYMLLLPVDPAPAALSGTRKPSGMTTGGPDTH